MEGAEVKRHYNEKVKARFGGDYEYHRWFANPKKISEYEMTRATLKMFLPHLSYTHFLELGPGAGTWTKLFIEHEPGADYHVVEISDEMIFQLKENVGHVRRFTVTHGDFLEFTPNKTFDFFFSSRAVEYIRDKRALARKIADLLSPGGFGLIITKMPKYTRHKLIGRAERELHQEQIEPQRITQLLREAGCRDIRLRPVTLYFPFIDSVKINQTLFRILGKRKLNVISQFFAESYCVSFHKS